MTTMHPTRAVILAPLRAACLDPLLTLLYPPRCLLCRTMGERDLCAACLAEIAALPPPASGAGRALWSYEGRLREAIHHFKYRDRPQLALPLGTLLAAAAHAQAAHFNDLLIDAVVPVPMHSARQRERGYNQSERLARVLAADLSLPLDTRSLRRVRPTRPQVGLTGEARRANLQGAFAVSHPEAVAGKTLLLIDDVSTTGSTIIECAGALQAAGAGAVYALTLAAG